MGVVEIGRTAVYCDHKDLLKSQIIHEISVDLLFSLSHALLLFLSFLSFPSFLPYFLTFIPSYMDSQLS